MWREAIVELQNVYPMKLIFATHNQGKVKEMRMMLADLDVEVVSQEEAGVIEEVVEDGKTFEENALKKARLVAERTAQWVVADDSGICIDALGGAPGIHSARWGGQGKSDEEVVQFTLAQMKDVAYDKRGAVFVSTLALVALDGRHWIFLGEVRGRIADEPRGTPRPHLPYDRLFLPEGHTRTFAEMSDAEKNSMSHRGRAFTQLKEFLKTLA